MTDKIRELAEKLTAYNLKYGQLTARARELEPTWREEAFKRFPGLTIGDARVHFAAWFAQSIQAEACQEIEALKGKLELLRSARKR